MDCDRRFRILVFGDSNTWGFTPITGARLAEGSRWPTVAGAELADRVSIIEEGLCGRTTALDDPVGGGRNGAREFEKCLERHLPLDGVTLMLGTNDFKTRFGATAEGVTRSIGQLLHNAVDTVSPSPRLLVIIPPHLEDRGPFAAEFSGGIELSKRLFEVAVPTVREFSADILDASEHCRVSEADGIHLDERGHRSLGRAVAGIWRAWANGLPVS